jgi:hypothetical protein
MIKYSNLIIYGLAKKDLPARGTVIELGQKGLKKIYQFYSADKPFSFLTTGIERLTQFLPDPPANHYFCIRKGFVQPISQCEIIAYTQYFYGKQSQNVTVFAMKDDGVFMQNGKCFIIKNNRIIKK